MVIFSKQLKLSRSILAWTLSSNPDLQSREIEKIIQLFNNNHKDQITRVIFPVSGTWYFQCSYKINKTIDHILTSVKLKNLKLQLSDLSDTSRYLDKITIYLVNNTISFVTVVFSDVITQSVSNFDIKRENLVGCLKQRWPYVCIGE